MLRLGILLLGTVLLGTCYGSRMKLHHRIPKASDVLVVPEKDIQPGYIFVGEQSICSCPQNIVYLNFVEYLLNNVIPYGCNGYGIRQFGDKTFNDTEFLTGYYSRDWVLRSIGYWSGDDQKNCTYSEAVTYQSVLLDILNLLQAGGRSPVGIFIQGETDTIVDLDVSLSIARQIAAYNPILYIWDHSVWGDQTGLFSTLTNNQPGRVFYSQADTIELYKQASVQMLGNFASIGCGSPTNNGTLPLPAVVTYPGKPSYCSGITPTYRATTTTTAGTSPTTIITRAPSTSTSTAMSLLPTTTTTTTSAPTTTTYRSTTTTTTRPPISSNGTCTCILFAGEMSGTIPLQGKQNFYDVVGRVASSLPRDLQFGISTYGSNISPQLSCQSYNTFITTLVDLKNKLPNPNASYTVITPILNEIYNIILSVPQKVAVLFMGENQAIKDPNSGHTIAVKIANTKTNVYVLDYTTTNALSLWPYLNGNNPERIINGTGITADQIFAAFQSTMVFDVNNNHC